jgi:hypothetical protein
MHNIPKMSHVRHIGVDSAFSLMRLSSGQMVNIAFMTGSDSPAIVMVNGNHNALTHRGFVLSHLYFCPLAHVTLG